MARKDQSHPPDSSYPAAAEGSSVGDLELAQHIARRYGYSPGVMPAWVTLQPVRPASRFGAGTVSVLADVFRRCLLGRATFLSGSSMLPYAGLLGFTNLPSPMTSEGKRAATTPAAALRPWSIGSQEAPILRHPVSIPSRVAVQHNVASQDLVPLQSHSAIDVRQSGGQLLTSRGSLTGPQGNTEVPSRSVGPPISPDESAGVQWSRAGEGQHAYAGARVPAQRSSDPGAAVLRRHGSTPARHDVQPKPASSDLVPPQSRLAGDIRQSAEQRLNSHGSLSGQVGVSLPSMTPALDGAPAARLHTGLQAATDKGPGTDSFRVARERLTPGKVDLVLPRGGPYSVSQQFTVRGKMATVQRKVADAEAGTAGGDQSGEKAGSSLSRVGQSVLRQSFEGTVGTIPPLSMPLLKTAARGGAAPSRAVRFGTTFSGVGLEMALPKMQEPGVEQGQAGRAMQMQTQRVDTPLVLSAPAGDPASFRNDEKTTAQHGLQPGTRATTGTQVGPGIVSEAGTRSETDADNLVDRVLRKLMRQLAVESERRGWQRWP